MRRTSQKDSRYEHFPSGANYPITEYDESLVRLLIEKVTVYADKFTVEFKSGLTMDVNE
jgi:site-specific DNA recombinase